MIQNTLLIKKLNFKTPTIISIISSVVAGTCSIYLALNGYGIWSLIFLSLIRQFITSILLWYSASWRPRLMYSKNSFKELFHFGYKLLLASFINTIYKNIYYVLIGKYFSPKALGYYTRADQFQAPFSSNIALAIRKISFPILSTIQDDNEKLKKSFIKFVRFSVFLNFHMLLFIAAISEPMILMVIGEKWFNSIVYLQLLCVAGLLYPLHILHLNLLVVKGFSDLNLRLEITKKIILIPIILITVSINIKVMIYGLIVFSIIEYFINSFYTKKLINYTIKQQIKDILPFILISFIVFCTVWAITLLTISYSLMLIFQLIIGLLTFIAINETLQLIEYIEIKRFVLKKLENYSKIRKK